MPFANYKFPQGTLNAKQKEEIIHKTTDIFAEYFRRRRSPLHDGLGRRGGRRWLGSRR